MMINYLQLPKISKGNLPSGTGTMVAGPRAALL